MKYTLPPPLFASPPPPSGHAACSGCGLCQLVCPVWRGPGPLARDVEMTPHGRAKALQNGATAVEIATSIESCTFCGACEAVCPEQMSIVELTLALRRELNIPLPPAITAAADIAVSLAPTFHLVTDSGPAIDASVDQIEAYLRPLRSAGMLVVSNGLLLRHLQRWIPGKPMISLGKLLSQQPAARSALGPKDLYIIDAQAYNLDYEANVLHYDTLRHETGCQTNLDLQRIAMPADDAAQAQWILRGLQPARIVIENETHRAIFAALGNWPVIHVAELATGIIHGVKH